MYDPELSLTSPLKYIPFIIMFNSASQHEEHYNWEIEPAIKYANYSNVSPFQGFMRLCRVIVFAFTFSHQQPGLRHHSLTIKIQ